MYVKNQEKYLFMTFLFLNSKFSFFGQSFFFFFLATIWLQKWQNKAVLGNRQEALWGLYSSFDRFSSLSLSIGVDQPVPDQAQLRSPVQNYKPVPIQRPSTEI